MKHNPVSGIPIFPLTDPPNGASTGSSQHSRNNNANMNSSFPKGDISLRMGLNNILINPGSSTSSTTANVSHYNDTEMITTNNTTNSKGQAITSYNTHLRSQNNTVEDEASMHLDETHCNEKAQCENDSIPAPPPSTSASNTLALEAAAASTAASNLIFPFKLLEIIENETPSVIEWTPSGKGFYIKDGIRDVLPKYFRQTKLQSFQRQLNLYGFSRMNKGPECGAYYHAKFSRDKPELIGTIKRLPGHGARATARAAREEMGSHGLDGIENSDKSDGDNNTSNGNGYSAKEKYGNQSIALNGSGNKSSEKEKEKDGNHLQQQQQQQQRILRQQQQPFSGFTAYHQAQAGHIQVQGIPHNVNIVPTFSHTQNVSHPNPNGTLNPQKHTTATNHNQMYGLTPAYGSHIQHQQTVHSQHFHGHPPHTQNSYLSTVNVNGHPRTIQVIAVPSNYNPGGPQQQQQMFRGAPPSTTQQIYNATNIVNTTTGTGSISGGNSANNSKTTTPINSSSTPPNASNGINNLNSVSNLTLGPTMIQNQQHTTTSQLPPTQILNTNNSSTSNAVKQQNLSHQLQQSSSLHLGKQGGTQSASSINNINNNSNKNNTLTSSTMSSNYVSSQSSKPVEQLHGNINSFYPTDGRKCGHPKTPVSSYGVLSEPSIMDKPIFNEGENKLKREFMNKEENNFLNKIERKETSLHGEREKQDGDEVSECGRLRSLSVVSESEVDTEGEGNGGCGSSTGRKRKSVGNVDNNLQKAEFSSPIDTQSVPLGQGENYETLVFNSSTTSSSTRISTSSPSRCLNVNGSTNMNLINHCQYKERVPLTERVKQGIIHPTAKGRERASTISSMPQTNIQPIRSQYTGGHSNNMSTTSQDVKREDSGVGVAGVALASNLNSNNYEMKTNMEMNPKIESKKDVPTSVFGEEMRCSPVLGIPMDTRPISASKLSKRVKVTPTNEDRRVRMSRSLQASPVGSSISMYPLIPSFSLENGSSFSTSNNSFTDTRTNSNVELCVDQLYHTYDIKMKYEEDVGTSDLNQSILDVHLKTSVSNGFSFHYFDKTAIILSGRTDSSTNSINILPPIKDDFDPIERKMIPSAVKFMEQGERVCLVCAENGKTQEAYYFPQITPFQFPNPRNNQKHPLCLDKLKIGTRFLCQSKESKQNYPSTPSAVSPSKTSPNITYSRKKIDSLNEIKHIIRCTLVLGVGEKSSLPNLSKDLSDQITFFSHRNTILMLSAEWGLRGGEDLVCKDIANSTSDKRNEEEREPVEITPEDMAFCYQEVLQEEKYIGLYKAIHFIFPTLQSSRDQAVSSPQMKVEGNNLSNKNYSDEGNFYSDKKFQNSSLYLHRYPPARICKAFSQILGNLITYRQKPDEKIFVDASSVNTSTEVLRNDASSEELYLHDADGTMKLNSDTKYHIEMIRNREGSKVCDKENSSCSNTAITDEQRNVEITPQGEKENEMGGSGQGEEGNLQRV